MPLILISFLAGILTALAPCVLPIIPVVIGGSISGDKNDNKKPYIVTLSLFISIVVFTLLLKGSTLFIQIPDAFWRYFSATVIIFFGATLTFPGFWTKLTGKLRLYEDSQGLLGKAYKRGGIGGAILIGAALGPVFSSCSPVYLFLLSAVLPSNFGLGLIYIIAYALGLCLVLLLVGIFGQKIITKFGWASNPNGWFKRGLGIVLIVASLLILTGLDRSIQLYVIEHEILDVTKIDQILLQNKK